MRGVGKMEKKSKWLMEPKSNGKTTRKQIKTTKVSVEKIPCYCAIGINVEERKTGQRLLIDVHLHVDSSCAVKSDNINDTVSYVEIYKTVQRIAHLKPHSLIEVLAEEISETFLKYPLVVKAGVRIHKLHIPFPEFQGEVSVEVEREK